MTHIKTQTRRKFLKNMARAGAMLPFAGQMLSQNAFAAGSGYKNVLFIYHPNGIHYNHWLPQITGPINTTNELSFGLGALKQHHNNIIVFKNIYIDIEKDGGGNGNGHTHAQLGCLTGDWGNDALPSIDHLIAEKLGNQGVLSLGVRTGNSTNEGKSLMVSKPRGVVNAERPIPNNNPFDVATKLSSRVAPPPADPLQGKIYAASIADMNALPKAQLIEGRQGKIKLHQDALLRLKDKQAEGVLNVPFNFDVKETLAAKDNVKGSANAKELFEQFPALCKAQIDNAVAAFANKLHRVATLQLSTGNENDGRVNYSFDECWDMTLLARERNAGNSFVERIADRSHGDHASHSASHNVNSCSFQAQVRWHFSLVGYALEKLKSAGILDETLIVTISDEGDSDHELSRGGIVVAGGTGGGLSMGRVIDCGSAPGGTHKLFGDIARWLGASVNEGPWKSGII